MTCPRTWHTSERAVTPAESLDASASAAEDRGDWKTADWLLGAAADARYAETMGWDMSLYATCAENAANAAARSQHYRRT
jgi:hypothetical protein